MPDPPPRALEAQMQAALASREARLIRRRLPLPSAPASPSAPAPINLTSNDYLSLSTSPALRSAVLARLTAAPSILGAGGSRLLVPSAPHTALEARLARLLRAPAALLFNSGFDANAALLAALPQPRDAVVHDAAVHASTHDGLRLSRLPPARRRAFAHNDVRALVRVLRALRREDAALCAGRASVFVCVESVYSMDGTMAPLGEIVGAVEAAFPLGNAYVVVDEAHATGVYGPGGRGVVAMLGLEERVFARVHTFGKALAASGGESVAGCSVLFVLRLMCGVAVVLGSELLKDYLINYARPLIYTTSLSHASIIAADCSFDLLEDGTAEKLAAHLLDLASHFVDLLRAELTSIPPDILALPAHLQTPFPPSADPDTDTDLLPIPPDPRTYAPTPIIPLLTPHPRPLSAFLAARGIVARPITWPTVPKGADRVRVCLHAGLTRAQVARVAREAGAWARGVLEERRAEEQRRRRRLRGVAVRGLVESKL
ncbi:PLP-dependent transferase [Dentipellis sp. KUC8613]|nr:PLP-dependent transferase [Dentipellis sp. KUC8613]